MLKTVRNIIANNILKYNISPVLTFGKKKAERHKITGNEPKDISLLEENAVMNAGISLVFKGRAVNSLKEKFLNP
jgi:hypothetical protein